MLEGLVGVKRDWIDFQTESPPTVEGSWLMLTSNRRRGDDSDIILQRKESFRIVQKKKQIIAKDLICLSEAFMALVACLVSCQK